MCVCAPVYAYSVQCVCVCARALSSVCRWCRNIVIVAAGPADRILSYAVSANAERPDDRPTSNSSNRPTDRPTDGIVVTSCRGELFPIIVYSRRQVSKADGATACPDAVYLFVPNHYCLGGIKKIKYYRYYNNNIMHSQGHDQCSRLATQSVCVFLFSGLQPYLLLCSTTVVDFSGPSV